MHIPTVVLHDVDPPCPITSREGVMVAFADRYRLGALILRKDAR
jgi:hypothetical protein